MPARKKRTANGSPYELSLHKGAEIRGVSMNKIESYIASVIPKNIPKYKQKILRDEIEAHIFDRIDFYTEIGYDNEASMGVCSDRIRNAFSAFLVVLL